LERGSVTGLESMADVGSSCPLRGGGGGSFLIVLCIFISQKLALHYYLLLIRIKLEFVFLNALCRSAMVVFLQFKSVGFSKGGGLEAHRPGKAKTRFEKKTRFCFSSTADFHWKVL
jgi:hypothetical protein